MIGHSIEKQNQGGHMLCKMIHLSKVKIIFSRSGAEALGYQSLKRKIQ